MAPSSLLVIALLSTVGLAQVHVSQAQNSPKDFLGLHNAARKQVGLGPMTWNITVEKYAQNYAKVRAADCELIHSQGPYGENIYWGYGEGYIDAAAAIKYWVDEKNDYDYGSNTCVPGKECLHYTQIVWRDSVRLGCARVMCPGDKFFITCNYDPPGNIIGQKPY